LIVSKLNDKNFEVFLNGHFLEMPKEIQIVNLLEKMPSKVLVNGKEIKSFDEKKFRIKEFPSIVRIQY
jgi:hypothetical protein